MSHLISRESILPAVTVLKDVIEARSNIPTLQHIKLDVDVSGAVLTGTDLDMTVAARVPVENGESHASMLIPHKALLAFTKSANKGALLEFAASEGFVKIKAGAVESSLPSTPVADFPNFEFGKATLAEVELDARGFGAALERTAFCISHEEARYYLNGVFAHCVDDGVLRLVTTDGHRLGRAEIPAPVTKEMPGVIIPRKAVALLIKQCLAKGARKSIAVRLNKSQIEFVLGNLTILTKTIDGAFPDYARVVPPLSNPATRIVFDRARLLGAMKQVEPLVARNGKAFKLSAGDLGCAVYVDNPDTGAMRVPLDDCAAVYGDPVEVGFNARYMREILAADDSETVELRLRDNGSPCLVGPESDPLAFVLMPVRI